MKLQQTKHSNVLFKHRVNDHTEVVCKVTKFLSSALQASTLPCSSHVIRNAWAEDEACGVYPLFSMMQRQENKNPACLQPKWQVQHHPGNNTPLQKCMSGVSVPVITTWRRHCKSQRCAFLLHLNVCTLSSVDTIGWGLCLSAQLCL